MLYNIETMEDSHLEPFCIEGESDRQNTKAFCTTLDKAIGTVEVSEVSSQ